MVKKLQNTDYTRNKRHGFANKALNFSSRITLVKKVEKVEEQQMQPFTMNRRNWEITSWDRRLLTIWERWSRQGRLSYKTLDGHPDTLEHKTIKGCNSRLPLLQANCLLWENAVGRKGRLTREKKAGKVSSLLWHHESQEASPLFSQVITFNF